MANMEEPEERREESIGEEGGVSMSSIIHGHVVVTSLHDQGPRTWLRSQDRVEVKPVFDYARLHRDKGAEFETHLEGHPRENYGMKFKGGRYKVTDQGVQKPQNQLA